MNIISQEMKMNDYEPIVFMHLKKQKKRQIKGQIKRQIICQALVFGGIEEWQSLMMQYMLY